MSTNQNPFDVGPEGTDGQNADAGQNAEAGQSSHPYDPLGGSASDPYASNPQDSSSQAFGSNEQHGANQQHGAGTQYTGAPHPGQQPADEWSNTPPAGTPGVYEGPLTGAPVSESDAKLWAVLGQLSVLLGYFGWVLGWVGPLIVYLVYKDRNRFIRFHAAEALNGAIAATIASVVLAIATLILTVVTFGMGSILFPIIGLPQLIQLIFAIIAAVKANDRQWWAYPFNLRFVR